MDVHASSMSPNGLAGIARSMVASFHPSAKVPVSILHVLLAYAATACISMPSRTSSIPPTSSVVPVRIENGSACDLRVRVEESGTTRATYRIPSYVSATVLFTPLQRLDQLRFIAEPMNACGRPFTIGTLIQSPKRIAVSIGSQPGDSTVSPVDTSPDE